VFTHEVKGMSLYITRALMGSARVSSKKWTSQMSTRGEGVSSLYMFRDGIDKCSIDNCVEHWERATLVLDITKLTHQVWMAESGIVRDSERKRRMTQKKFTKSNGEPILRE
jgi:hypothetical protein